jgi:hypothetical protein
MPRINGLRQAIRNYRMSAAIICQSPLTVSKSMAASQPLISLSGVSHMTFAGQEAPASSSTNNIPPSPGRTQAQNARLHDDLRWIGAKSAFRMPRRLFGPRIVDSRSVATCAFVVLSPPAPGHIGAALGGMAANRRIRSRIARYSRRGIATSANWNITY